MGRVQTMDNIVSQTWLLGQLGDANIVIA